MREKRVLTKEEERRLTARAVRDPLRNAMLQMVWRAGLTVEETASLRWADVDLSVPCVRAGGRTIPLAPEAVSALKALGKEREWVFPSRRNLGQPMVRMTVNRELRQLLDEAGLADFRPRDLKNLHILRVLEETTLEEAVRITGVEAVTLRDTWKEHGRTEPPRATPAGSVPPNDLALERALEAEGDTLDGRIIRLSWQGGLYLRDIHRLRWTDISPGFETWTIGAERETRPVPACLRPWLWVWNAGGGEYVAEGPRSGKPLDETALSHRTAIFFARYGLEGMSVANLRGNGQVEEADLLRFLAVVSRRGHCTMKFAQTAAGLSPNQARAAAAALRLDGRLDREGGEELRLPGLRLPRERFRGVLEKSAGETLSTGELRRRSGVGDSSIYNYIREALREGCLEKKGFGQYHVPDRKR